MRINLARVIPHSAANGPGERFVVWVQGCPLGCPGCWNPDTWSFAPRRVLEVEDLVGQILETRDIEGVTFTGGEPFAQARALARVGRAAREAGLSVFVFTGFELDELTRPRDRELLEVTDVVVAGRYIEQQRALGLPWRGSSNQRVHFLTGRYSKAELGEVTMAEVWLEGDGKVTLCGFPDGELVRDLGGWSKGTR